LHHQFFFIIRPHQKFAVGLLVKCAGNLLELQSRRVYVQPSSFLLFPFFQDGQNSDYDKEILSSVFPTVNRGTNKVSSVDDRYSDRSLAIRHKWKKHAKKVMYAVGVCSKGVTDLYFVPPTTRVDCWFFIHSILKPIVKKDILRLYPGEEHKVVLHFDSAGSHTTPEVYGWFNERNVKYIWKEEWLSNSLDLSPMDFSLNGIFKQILFLISSLDRLKKILQEEWEAILQQLIQESIES
jgi:hypothetical protein